jgi:hypothetical protein
MSGGLWWNFDATTRADQAFGQSWLITCPGTGPSVLVPVMDRQAKAAPFNNFESEPN